MTEAAELRTRPANWVESRLLNTSDALGTDGPKSTGQDQNILLIGLDSRKAAIFHSFFHRCGKLWGETKRPSRRLEFEFPRRRPTVAQSSAGLLTLTVRLDAKGCHEGKAHVSAEHASPQEDAWIPRANEHQERTARPQAAPRERAQAAHG